MTRRRLLCGSSGLVGAVCGLFRPDGLQLGAPAREEPAGPDPAAPDLDGRIARVIGDDGLV